MEQVELRTLGTQMGKKSVEEMERLHHHNLNETFQKEEERKEATEGGGLINPNSWSSALLWWVWPVLKLGKDEDIKLEDLPKFRKEEQAAQVETLFDPYWKELKDHWKALQV